MSSASVLITSLMELARDLQGETPEVRKKFFNKRINRVPEGKLLRIAAANPKIMKMIVEDVSDMLEAATREAVEKEIKKANEKANREQDDAKSVSSNSTEGEETLATLEYTLSGLDINKWGDEAEIADIKQGINTQRQSNSYAAHASDGKGYNQHFPKTLPIYYHGVSRQDTRTLPNNRKMPIIPTNTVIKVVPWKGDKPCVNPEAKSTDWSGLLGAFTMSKLGFLQHTNPDGMPFGWIAQDESGKTLKNNYNHVIRSQHHEAWVSDTMTYWLTPMHNCYHRHRANCGVWEHQLKGSDGKWPTGTTPYAVWYERIWEMRPRVASK